MATTTTPAQRLQRLLGEGVQLMAHCPGQTSIDVTPDIQALMDTVHPPDEVASGGLTRWPGHESSHKPG